MCTNKNIIIESSKNMLLILDKIGNENSLNIDSIYLNDHETFTIEFLNEESESLNLEIGNLLFAYYLKLNGSNIKFFNSLSFSEENINKLIENIKLLNI